MQAATSALVQPGCLCFCAMLAHQMECQHAHRYSANYTNKSGWMADCFTFRADTVDSLHGLCSLLNSHIAASALADTVPKILHVALYRCPFARTQGLPLAYSLQPNHSVSFMQVSLFRARILIKRDDLFNCWTRAAPAGTHGALSSGHACGSKGSHARRATKRAAQGCVPEEALSSKPVVQRNLCIVQCSSSPHQHTDTHIRAHARTHTHTLKHT
eukprot:scaffold149267_cov20-Tisochrysis_lutea.AAC.3